MRWFPSIVVVSLGTAACGPTARTEAGAATSATVSASASAHVPAPAVASANVEPPPRPPAPPFVSASAPAIAPDTSPGCVLETSGSFAYDGGLPLRVDPASTPFWRVREGGGRVTWPGGPGAPIATIVRDAFTVHGFVPDNLKVYAARGMLLAGVFSPTPATTFTLVGSAKGSVVPTIVAPLFRMLKPLAARPCKDFGLSLANLAPRVGLPPAKIGKKLYLRAGNIPVAASATEAPVLELSPALASTPVLVLEEAADRVRFVLERHEGNVVGWAAKADLLAEPGPPPDLGLGGLGLIGHGAGSGHGSVSLNEHECDKDVALYVDMTDASNDDRARLPYARVGTIQKKHRFKTRSGRGGLDHVAGQRLEGVIFTGQGSVTVSSEEISKVCRRVREGKK